MGKYDLSWDSIIEAEAIGRSMGYSEDDILTLALAIEDGNNPTKRAKKPVPGARTKYYNAIDESFRILKERRKAIKRNAPQSIIDALGKRYFEVCKVSDYWFKLGFPNAKKS